MVPQVGARDRVVPGGPSSSIHEGTSAIFIFMVIAMVPPFRRGWHCRQSKVIVEEGMGPDD